MRRHENPDLLTSLLLALLMGGCVSGTSTESENTVTGFAVLSDGSPAAGAVLTARSDALVTTGDVPAWRTLAADTADGLGRFKVRLPQGRKFFLEIRHDGLAGPDASGSKPEVFFSAYRAGLARSDSLGAFTLTPAGSLTGRCLFGTGGPPRGTWVGVLGTSALVELVPSADSAGASFLLEGLAPGEHVLTLVVEDVAGPMATSGGRTPPRAEVKPGSTTEMGTILY